MKTLFLIAAIIAAFTANASALAGRYGYVSNGNNDGQGSLRFALESGAKVIKISPKVSNVVLSEGLQYSRDGRLDIIGSGQTIDGSALRSNDNILTISNGANLYVSNLSFVGGLQSINDDPLTPVGGKGIYLHIPIERTGRVKVNLNNVSVLRVGNHGVHVSDCSLGDDCGGGSGGAGDGSPASISVILNDVLINGVGFGKADADGVRIDDRAAGDIYFAANNSTFTNIGADGIELDEGGNGSVIADVRNSVFNNNGEYCNLISRFEAGPCDDDGERDVDDGFDIDEAGDGDLYVSVLNTKVMNNFDEGLDFDEEGEGHITIRLATVLVVNNADEGVKASEEGGGNLSADFRRVTVVGNNGSKEGVELEEAGVGDVDVVVSSSSLIGADAEALKIEQRDEGEGDIRVRRSNEIVLDLDGVESL